jgi:hypothetical protein
MASSKIISSLEISNYRPNFMIGMRSICRGNIFADSTWWFVEKRSGLAIVGRKLRLCFVPSQLREAANVRGIEPTLVGLGA